MDFDYIIVGLGLAGIAFVEELKKHNKSFLVFDDSSQNSSLVAGGMYNPVVLKRFTPVWNAHEQLEMAIPFYQKLEKKFRIKLDHKLDIYRIFKSIEEQNNWFVACDKKLLHDYMIPELIYNSNKNIRAPFGMGKLTGTGRIDVKNLVKHYKKTLMEEGLLKKEKFYYDEMKSYDEYVDYKAIRAKRIVFCEGFGLKKNPFFNELPMKEVKGELITIHAPDLNIDYLIKSAVFMMPLGDNLYKVGATFNWNDKTKDPTKDGKEELELKLSSVINCKYKIVEHTAGIRPTIKDRRPILGLHPKNKKLAIFNGLGTRGVMIAPLMARKLYQHIENNMELDKEIAIDRFQK